MIIKIMAENDIERQKITEVEHTGVKEFFMFGNKKDKDGDLVDFNDWSGSYKFLEGNLYFFLTTITEEKRAASKSIKNEISIPSLQPQGQVKPPFIKKGQVDDGDVKVIDVEELSKNIEFPPQQNAEEVVGGNMEEEDGKDKE